MRVVTIVMLLLGLACAGDPTSAPRAPDPAVVAANLQTFPEAPEVGALEWLQGEPIDVATSEQLVVVELWATWCGPCREQFPHLSALAEEHAGTVQVIGLSDEHPATVRPFLKKHAEDMRYTVAVDAAAATTGRWSRAAGVSSIPHAFLVQGGRLLWHGHPSQLDPVLTAALAGTWTRQLADDLDDARALRTEYHRLLADGHRDDARRAGERILGLAPVAPGAANDLAWEILTEVPEGARDLELALRCAEAAAEADPENHNILDTYGLALYDSGRAAEAVGVQKRAVELCRAAATTGCGEFEERLHRFERG